MFWKKKQTDDSVLKMERIHVSEEALHKEFHVCMNLLLIYMKDQFGPEYVKGYLRKYTLEYHGPLKEELEKGNAMALVDYFEEIYDKENSPITLTFDHHHVVLEMDHCPAFSHIVEQGKTPSSMHRYTYETIFETLCDQTPFTYECEEYDEETGGGIHKFTKEETE